MTIESGHQTDSKARLDRRKQIVTASKALNGATAGADFDPVHSPICAIDVVMVAGAPWLQDGLERDFSKDESGYRKIGGGANTPAMSYFFRRAANLIHYLKRQGFYIPRGLEPSAASGMACFFDWDDRGRFNFTPDRSGIIVELQNGQISKVILAVQSQEQQDGFSVRELSVEPGDRIDRAIIGYSDLP